jgi:hypothetical protein
MDNLLTVAFEAHSHAENHHCRYQITVGRDPLDHWTVAICYGRTGQGGREIRFASPQPKEMRAVISDRLTAVCQHESALAARIALAH